MSAGSAQTVDPIFGERLDGFPTCDAHLLPQAASGAGPTVLAHARFDNAVGNELDCHLVALVENHRDERVNATIHVVDQQAQEIVARLKGDIKGRMSPSGVTPLGQFTIQYSKGTSDEWRERHMADGSLVKVQIHEPDLRRAALSMLHSAHLIAFRRFGDRYLRTAASEPARGVLVFGIAEDDMDMALRFGDLLHAAWIGFLKLHTRINLTHVIEKAFELHRHPILGLQLGDRRAMCVLLRYREDFTVPSFLPGFSESPLDEWVGFLTALASGESGPIQGVILNDAPPDVDLCTYWRELWSRAPSE